LQTESRIGGRIGTDIPVVSGEVSALSFLARYRVFQVHQTTGPTIVEICFEIASSSVRTRLLHNAISYFCH